MLNKIYVQGKEIWVPDKRIIVDRNEKITHTSYITNTFERNGLSVERRRIYAGDYMRPSLLTTVERKKSIAELSYNLGGEYREKFREELRMARKMNLHMVILIEDKDFQYIDELKGLTDITKGAKTPNLIIKARRCGMTGTSLYETLLAITRNFDVEVQFCSHMEAGERIMDILYGKGW